MTVSNARLAARFASLGGRAALIPYVTAGDPLVASTPALMHALAGAGVAGAHAAQCARRTCLRNYRRLPTPCPHRAAPT